MVAVDFMQEYIPPVDKKTSTEDLFELMDNLDITELALIDDKGIYLGLITENDLFNLDLATGVSDICTHSPYRSTAELFVYEDTHLYDILKVIDEHDLSIIPVVDHEKKYVGTIKTKDILKKIAQIFTAQVPGGIIVLKLESIHYSLAEISRLVEADSVRILSSFVFQPVDDPKTLLVTLKLNQEDLNHILATFERFKYQVIYHSSAFKSKSNSTERIDNLLKYLEF